MLFLDRDDQRRAAAKALVVAQVRIFYLKKCLNQNIRSVHAGFSRAG
jgi:hypothetical protein